MSLCLVIKIVTKFGERNEWLQFSSSSFSKQKCLVLALFDTWKTGKGHRCRLESFARGNFCLRGGGGRRGVRLDAAEPGSYDSPAVGWSIVFCFSCFCWLTSRVAQGTSEAQRRASSIRRNHNNVHSVERALHCAAVHSPSLSVQVLSAAAADAVYFLFCLWAFETLQTWVVELSSLPCWLARNLSPSSSLSS